VNPNEPLAEIIAEQWDDEVALDVVSDRSYDRSDNINGAAPRQRPAPGHGGISSMSKSSLQSRRVKVDGRGNTGIYRSSSGRLEIEYRVAGKLCWKSLPSGTSLSEARAARAELVVKKKEGTLAAPSKLTVSQACSTWLEEGRSQWAPSTYSSREAAMRIHVLPIIETVKLRELTDEHLWQVGVSMREQGKGASTIKLVLSQLASLFGHCADAKQLSVIPQLSRRRRAQIGAGESSEPVKVVGNLSALLEAAEPQWRLLIKTAALSGLRLAEVLGLRAQDVGTGVLHVRGQLDRVSRSWVPRTKTPSSKRDVLVPEGLTRELLAVVDSNTPVALIFTAGNGAGLWAQVVERAFDRAITKARLDDSLTFHCLRHTAASRWIAEGRSVSFVQGQLGHKTPALTLSTYTHQWGRATEEVAAREAADAAYAEATKPALKLVAGGD